MQKKFDLLKSIAFYVTIVIATYMKMNDIHFVNKTIGTYVLFLSIIIIFIYFRYIYKLPESDNKTKLYVFLPIVAILSLNIFVMYGLFALTFCVLGRYERTLFNKILKGVYRGIVVLGLVSIAYAGTFYMNQFELDIRYEGYVMAPDSEHVITIFDRGTAGGGKDFRYTLENVYFGFLRKPVTVLERSISNRSIVIEWQSDTEVLIRETIYDINNLPEDMEL